MNCFSFAYEGTQDRYPAGAPTICCASHSAAGCVVTANPNIRRPLAHHQKRKPVPGPANDHRDRLVELHATGFGFVQNEAFKWIDVARPRRLGQHLRRVCVARFPTEPNSAGTEVDIL